MDDQSAAADDNDGCDPSPKQAFRFPYPIRALCEVETGPVGRNRGYDPSSKDDDGLIATQSSRSSRSPCLVFQETHQAIGDRGKRTTV